MEPRAARTRAQSRATATTIGSVLNLRLRLRSFQWLSCVGPVGFLLLADCDNAYPEVTVVNATDERVLVREAGFSGCLWSAVLAYGEATAPQRCPPGSDRVHFKKFDAAKYCKEQVEDGALEGICPCDGGIARPIGPTDPGLTEKVPLWFNYQTVTEHHAGYGDFLRIEIRSGDMEQDFSIPGPYGH